PTSMALALFDIDHFKEINSRYLLSGGDHALQWLGQVFAQSVRTVDSIGRVGGEEFMLIAPETDADGAWILAERIRSTVEKSCTVFAGVDIRMTLSCGLVVVPENITAGYDQIRYAAAAALSEAKTIGRNRTVMRVLALPTERLVAAAE